MERVKWIEYKDKKIIFLDFSNLSPEHYQLIADALISNDRLPISHFSICAILEL